VVARRSGEKRNKHHVGGVYRRYTSSGIEFFKNKKSPSEKCNCNAITGEEKFLNAEVQEDAKNKMKY